MFYIENIKNKYFARVDGRRHLLYFTAYSSATAKL